MRSLSQILTPGRTLQGAPGVSKKRLFQTVAGLIAEDQISLPQTEVFNHLIAREKLGSTGLGKGIAIPHCRVPNVISPLGCLLTLDAAIDYDAPDEQRVDLIFALLVPEEAQQQHLDILAGIAGLFQQEAFCSALREAGDSADLYRIATTWEN